MRQENLNERKTSNFVEVNGTGTVVTKAGCRDVFVLGYFMRWGKFFIVHNDIKTPEFLTVSEASTGYALKDETYYTVDDALYFSLPFIDSKRYYFPTAVSNILVKTQRNLTRRNTTNLQTLAIDTALWL